MDRADFFCPSPARVRQSWARVRQPLNYFVRTRPEPDGVNASTVHNNDTFTNVFFYKYPAFIKLRHQQINILAQTNKCC